MNIFVSILAIIFLTFVLHLLINQSYNFLFFFFKKPILWCFFMGVLSFLYFFIGSRIEESFNVVFWSSFLAFMAGLPPQVNKTDEMDQKEKNKLVDDFYSEMGIKRGRLKYRFGLFCYFLGAFCGWILFYSETTSIVI